jgi:hypothetical protein
VVFIDQNYFPCTFAVFLIQKVKSKEETKNAWAAKKISTGYEI